MPIIGIYASQNYARGLSVDYLVVAGGGGGGYDNGGVCYRRSVSTRHLDLPDTTL